MRRSIDTKSIQVRVSDLMVRQTLTKAGLRLAATADGLSPLVWRLVVGNLLAIGGGAGWTPSRSPRLPNPRSEEP